MPNDLVPPTIEQLEAERARREAAEANVARMAEIARSAVAGRTPAPAAAPPPGPDPLAEFSEKAANLTADQATNLLDAGINRRINTAIENDRRQLGAAMGQVMFARDHQSAFDLVMATNPDIAADDEGFAAASAKAELRLRKQNRRDVPAGEFFRLAVNEYRKDHSQREVTPVDHVEGASTGEGARPPASAAPPPPIEEQVSPERQRLARAYGLDVTELREYDETATATQEAMVRDYVNDHNDLLESKGVFSRVPLVEMPAKARRSERKKKAAAAAAGG